MDEMGVITTGGNSILGDGTGTGILGNGTYCSQINKISN